MNSGTSVKTGMPNFVSTADCTKRAKEVQVEFIAWLLDGWRFGVGFCWGVLFGITIGSLMGLAAYPRSEEGR